jgi:hypothetical protein
VERYSEFFLCIVVFGSEIAWLISIWHLNKSVSMVSGNLWSDVEGLSVYEFYIKCMVLNGLILFGHGIL